LELCTDEMTYLHFYPLFTSLFHFTPHLCFGQPSTTFKLKP